MNFPNLHRSSEMDAIQIVPADELARLVRERATLAAMHEAYADTNDAHPVMSPVARAARQMESHCFTRICEINRAIAEFERIVA